MRLALALALLAACASSSPEPPEAGIDAARPSAPDVAPPSADPGPIPCERRDPRLGVPLPCAPYDRVVDDPDPAP